VDYERATTNARDGTIHRYYDPATGQFLSVDPLVDATGQPYAYTGDDPANGTDPLGLSGDPEGVFCSGGGTASECAGAAQIAKHVTETEMANDEEVGCIPTINIWGSISHFVASHKKQIVATVGLVAGTFALTVPGVDVLGGELDADSITAFTASEAGSSSLTEAVKGASALTAVGVDGYSCLNSPGVASCSSAVLGTYGTAVPGDLIDPAVAWGFSAFRYAATGG
jgi:RHS repeat-associated protein